MVCENPGVFVKTTRVRRGNRVYEYLSLVEAVREGNRTGHRTLLRLGEVSALRSSGQLERIVAALEAHLERERVDVNGLVAEDAPAVGGVAGIWAVWQRLGLDVWFAKVGAERGAEVLEHACFAMVANRLAGPCSKRRLGEWTAADVVMPAGWECPSLDQYYRALEAVADGKDATEAQLYAAVCDLTNLDLRLVCYDLTSTFWEGSARPSDRFPSRVFGYSRDHRSDRPQVVIGLLCTSDGIPIAHHVFAGNTADVSTLPGVLDDLAVRFGVGRVCVVADRGLISADNVEVLAGRGFGHVLATRLHRDPLCAAALAQAAADTTRWVEVPGTDLTACEILIDGQRCVVVDSPQRHERDTLRTVELVARTEAKLLALEQRVRDGQLVDPGKIGRACQRILGPSGVGRLFDVEIGPGRFVFHYNDDAFAYETLLAGRYVLTTSLTPAEATTAQIVARLPAAHRRRTPLPGPQGLPPPPTRPPLDRDPRARPHRHLRLRQRHRGPHHPRPRRPRPPRPRPRPPTPQRPPGPPRTRPDPRRHPHHRRTHHQPRHPPQPTPSPRPAHPRRRHHQLGPRHHPLNAPRRADVVETPITRAPAHQPQRATPAELGPEDVPSSVELRWRPRSSGGDLLSVAYGCDGFGEVGVEGGA